MDLGIPLAVNFYWIRGNTAIYVFIKKIYLTRLQTFRSCAVIEYYRKCYHNRHVQVKRTLNPDYIPLYQALYKGFFERIMTDSSSKKVYLPIPPPTVYKDDPRASLEESEQAMYDEVVKHFTQTDYSIPDIEKGELMDQEKFWLSRECILRFVS